MILKTYFNEFLTNIRPTSNQVQDCITGHTTLRNRLAQYESLKNIIVSTFLQGSYRRSTAIRPSSDKRSDVDVVVVTTLSQEDYSPQEAMDMFVPFLDYYYKDKYQFQGRSIGIKLSYVDLDLVITSAPSEVDKEMLQSESVTTFKGLEELSDWRLAKSWVAPEHRTSANLMKFAEASKEPEWKASPLYIPDRDVDEWQETHPLAQIQWTSTKNNSCNGHYVNIVKAIKWWRKLTYDDPKYPKGYPIEHIIGFCCPDSVASVADGVTTTLENIVSEFYPFISSKSMPVLKDHGVDQNVLARLTYDDFEAFFNHVVEAANTARNALDSNDKAESAKLWRDLFGSKFPEPTDSNGSSQNNGGFTRREESTSVSRERFA
jgi:hypothetical protein